MDHPNLDPAIDRGVANLWRQQRADGTWDVIGDVGPVITAQALIALRFSGRLPPDLTLAGLAACQRPDGGFNAWPDAPDGDLGTTATAWAALATAEDPAEDPPEDPAEDPQGSPAARARVWIDRHGGDAAILQLFYQGDPAPLFVAMAGRLDPHALPLPPIALWALPGVQRGLEGQLSAFFLNLLAEIYLILRRLRGDRPGRADHAARRYVLAFYEDFQNGDGSVNELPMQTAMLLATLHACGAAPDRQERAAAWIHAQTTPLPGRPELRTLSTFSSEIWATMHVVHTLIRAGVRPEDPRLWPAISWLCDARCADRQVSRLNPGPRRVRRGGWAFQKANVRLPDTDDTAVVLALVGAVTEDAAALPALDQARVRAAFAQGLAWLEDMQNDDGGWAAFTRGLPSKPPGPGPTGPPQLSADDPWRFFDGLRRTWASLGDPSTEGLTGRVLLALAAAGARYGEPAVDRAIVFLRQQQADNGGFWGRWFVNYLPTTAWVLAGLAAVHAPLDPPWVRRAIRFILDHQRDDGSFGEGVESYPDPAQAGRGPRGMAGLTGIVVASLVAVGMAEHPSVRRAVTWLLDTQRPDGSWDDGGWLAPYLPPRMFYRYPGASDYAPLDALTRVRAAWAHAAPPAPGPLARSRSERPTGARFLDTWELDVAVERVWQVLSLDPSVLPKLPLGAVVLTEPAGPDGTLPGGQFRFDTPLGFGVEIGFSVEEQAAPHLLVNRFSGDLDGVGMWVLLPSPAGCHVMFYEHVVPSGAALRRVATLSRRLSALNHDGTMAAVMARIARAAGARRCRHLGGEDV